MAGVWLKVVVLLSVCVVCIVAKRYVIGSTMLPLDRAMTSSRLPVVILLLSPVVWYAIFNVMCHLHPLSVCVELSYLALIVEFNIAASP